MYLIVHSGSRHFGLIVAKLYQERAAKSMKDSGKADQAKIKETTRALTAEGKSHQIPEALDAMKKASAVNGQNRDLAYLTGVDRDHYLHDIQLVQAYARRNRQRISETLLYKMDLKESASFESVHNYIDDNNILRKGAIAAHAGQRVIIPLNMRDGCILGMGKGNPEWNWSALHGAGRLMSRHEAKKRLFLEEFQNQMKGIFSTCVDRTTLDESPMAYKAVRDILPALKDTIDIDRILRPIYNFKTGKKNRREAAPFPG